MSSTNGAHAPTPSGPPNPASSVCRTACSLIETTYNHSQQPAQRHQQTLRQPWATVAALHSGLQMAARRWSGPIAEHPQLRAATLAQSAGHPRAAPGSSKWASVNEPGNTGVRRCTRSGGSGTIARRRRVSSVDNRRRIPRIVAMQAR